MKSQSGMRATLVNLADKPQTCRLRTRSGQKVVDIEAYSAVILDNV